jgi:hypothetical protein
MAESVSLLDRTISQFQKNEFLYIAGATAGVAGVASAAHQFKKDRQLSFQDRAGNAAMEGARGVLGGTVLAGIAYAGYKNRGPVGIAARNVAQLFQRQAQSALREAELDRTLLSALIPTSATHAAHLKAIGAETMSSSKAALLAYGRNTKLMVGGGAGAGFLIGAAYGHPLVGAAVGAGVGLAGKAGIGASQMWKAAGKIPGLRTAGVVAASALLFTGIQAVAPRSYENETVANPDGMGGYATTSDRLQTIGATGDLVLGLSRGRHG